MISTLSIMVCSWLLVFVRGQEGPCPQNYPSNCKCFPKPKWVSCENMQATTEFPRGVFNNDTKWLTVEKSRITNLTKEDFMGLPELTQLDISQGSLSFIQEGTFQQLVHLTQVTLKENQLVSFSRGLFANMSKLETVRLGKNPFEVLPDGMFENSPLKNLLITSSKLNSTGLDGIGSGRVSKTLTSLHLDYSNLPRLANEQFSGLPNLQEIGLLSCKIQYIHTDFLKGTKVTKVNLYENNIVKIYPDAMRGDQITWFDCRYCGLTTEKVFGNESFIRQMTALERLDLGHNEIRHVPKDAFQGLSKITTLLLFYNNISTIDENPFTVFKDLESFGIQNNPFNCDCHLAWFRKFAVAHFNEQLAGKDVLKNMICASPSDLAGKKFTDVSESQFCCAATNHSSRVCGDVDSKGTTVRPTGGILFLKPGFLACIVISFAMMLT